MAGVNCKMLTLWMPRSYSSFSKWPPAVSRQTTGVNCAVVQQSVSLLADWGQSHCSRRYQPKSWRWSGLDTFVHSM